MWSLVGTWVRGSWTKYFTSYGAWFLIRQRLTVKQNSSFPSFFLNLMWRYPSYVLNSDWEQIFFSFRWCRAMISHPIGEIADLSQGSRIWIYMTLVEIFSSPLLILLLLWEYPRNLWNSISSFYNPLWCLKQECSGWLGTLWYFP